MRDDVRIRQHTIEHRAQVRLLVPPQAALPAPGAAGAAEVERDNAHARGEQLCQQVDGVYAAG